MPIESRHLLKRVQSVIDYQSNVPPNPCQKLEMREKCRLGRPNWRKMNQYVIENYPRMRAVLFVSFSFTDKCPLLVRSWFPWRRTSFQEAFKFASSGVILLAYVWFSLAPNRNTTSGALNFGTPHNIQCTLCLVHAKITVEFLHMQEGDGPMSVAFIRVL